MEKKSENFSVQEAMRIAKTDAGKDLIKILQEENSAVVASIQQNASSGNMEQVKSSVQALLASDKVRSLLDQIRRESNG